MAKSVRIELEIKIKINMRINKKILNKINGVLETIREQKEFKVKEYVFVISFDNFAEIPCSEDIKKELIDAFKIIQLETKGNVIIKTRKPQFTNELLEVGEEMSPSVLVQIKDYSKFNDYYTKNKRQINEGTLPTFILDNTGLYKKDDKEKKLIYPIHQEGLRYNIIHYLATTKNWTQAKILSQEFGRKSIRIRKTIEQIKRQIEKFLKIPGGKIIESKIGLGYRVKNIKIKKN